MKFIPMLMVAGALLTFTTITQAQTRVNPNRSADVLNAQVLEVLRAGPATTPVAAAPAPVTVRTAPTPVTTQGTGMNLTGIYVGGFAGSNMRDNSDYQVGGVVGYQFHRNWAAEVTYDYNSLTNRTDGQMAMGNLVYSRQLGQTAVTPYVLTGVGVGWNALGERGTGDNLTLYNVGGGVRLNVVQNVDVDARYRYVGAFNDALAGNQHVVTGGVTIRF